MVLRSIRGPVYACCRRQRPIAARHVDACECVCFHIFQAKDKLKTEYTDDMTIKAGLKLAAGVLAKTMDVSPTVERMEFSILTQDAATGRIKHHLLTEV